MSDRRPISHAVRRVGRLSAIDLVALVAGLCAWDARAAPPPSISGAHQPAERFDIPDAPPPRPLDLPGVRAVTEAALRTGHAALDDARTARRVPPDSVDTVEWQLDRIEEAVEDEELDSCRLARLPAVVADARALAAGTDVVAARRGAFWRAYRSPIDGSLQPYAVYLPPDYDPRRSYPLVVALHGMNGSGMRSMAEMFGLSDDQGLSDEAIDCADPVVPDGREVIAVGPTGFGNTFYRLEGEADVMTVLDLVESRYAVDRTHVYITGPSMGGSGTTEIGLEHPDRFAAMVSLVGYHDRRLDSWVDDARPRLRLYPWESFEAEAHSPVDWAANGLHLPLWTQHGLRDDPRRSLRMLDAYRALGYEAHGEWWDTGHFVQYVAYQGGRLFDLLARYRLDPNPAHVVYRTPGLRHDGAYWVRILRAQAQGVWMSVDARVDAPDHLLVHTDHVSAVRLSPAPPLVTPGSPLTTVIDGVKVVSAVDASGRVTLSRERGHWQAAPVDDGAGDAGRRPFPGVKRHGLSGPIEDLFYDPVVVVYGTQIESERTVAYTVASRFAARHVPASVHYPLVADYDLTADQVASASLLLVGSPADNTFYRRIAARLPIQVEGDGVHVGGVVFDRPDTGIMMIYPDPLAPTHYVLVVSGTSPHALELALALPDYLPDYVVYDGRMTNGPELGHVFAGHPLDCAGYFDGAWRLSPDAGQPPPTPEPWPLPAVAAR